MPDDPLFDVGFSKIVNSPVRMSSTPTEQLKVAIDRIVKSQSRKKLVVAGPGTGKTTLFKLLLDSSTGDPGSHIVLTFINNLKTDLERSLSDRAKVFTLHGYSQLLLHRHGSLRAGLTADFKCFPGLATLIKEDWIYLRGAPAPKFVEEMRDLRIPNHLDFYLARADYYDAVDFDDSVYRLSQQLRRDPTQAEAYDLVLTQPNPAMAD